MLYLQINQLVICMNNIKYGNVQNVIILIQYHGINFVLYHFCRWSFESIPIKPVWDNLKPINVAQIQFKYCLSQISGSGLVTSALPSISELPELFGSAHINPNQNDENIPINKNQNKNKNANENKNENKTEINNNQNINDNKSEEINTIINNNNNNNNDNDDDHDHDYIERELAASRYEYLDRYARKIAKQFIISFHERNENENENNNNNGTQLYDFISDSDKSIIFADNPKPNINGKYKVWKCPNCQHINSSKWVTSCIIPNCKYPFQQFNGEFTFENNKPINDAQIKFESYCAKFESYYTKYDRYFM